MKLTYLILLTLAIFACLASVADAGRKKNKGVGKGSKKGSKRFNAVGKGKKRGGRKGGKRRKFNKDEDDEEEDEKKSKRGRGKGRKNRRQNKKNKKGKKTRKGSKNFSKGKKGGKKGEKKERKQTRKVTRKGGDEKKGPKMCKRYEMKELPGNVVVEYQSHFPDGFYEVVKAAADFGYTGGCEAWFCVGKKWEIKQYTCSTCTIDGYIYDVGQCLPISDYVKKQCMVNPAGPELAGVWKTVGSRDFPMSLTQIMKYSDNPDMCWA